MHHDFSCPSPGQHITVFDIPSCTKARQRAALLARLKTQGAATTIEIREDMGICHPAGRVAELRAAGVLIETTLAWVEDSDGRRHKCAVYSLGGAHHG